MSFKLKISPPQQAREKLVVHFFAAGSVARPLANRKQYPVRCLVSCRYSADPESSVLKAPQTDSLSSGAALSMCPQSRLKKHGIYLIASGTGNQQSG